MGHQEIVLQVKGPKDKVYSVIEGLSGIKNITVNGILEEDLCEYTVQSEIEKIYEKAFYAMAENEFSYTGDEIILYVP